MISYGIDPRGAGAQNKIVDEIIVSIDDKWRCSSSVRLVCRRGRITQASFQRSCFLLLNDFPPPSRSLEQARMYKALFTKQIAAWRRSGRIAWLMMWGEMKQGHIGLDSALDLWLIGHFNPKLECIALSFLLEWKLGVKGNRLNLKGSRK